MMRKPALSAALAIAAASLSTPALARNDPSAEAQLKQILRCNGIADQNARITCYDEAARRALSAGTKPAIATAPADPVPTPEQAFGAESIEVARRPPSPPRPKPLERITEKLLARVDDGRGYWLFRLNEGSTWQMNELSEFEPPRVGDLVTIRRGPLGGYMMDFGKAIAVRVSRLQ